MRCVTREPIATTSLPRELMTQKRWVDVEDFATDSEREAIDGDEPEPEIGWRASLDVWPQLCSRTLVVQVIVCDTMDAYTMQLPFLAALRSELFDIGYTNALGYRAPFLHCSGGAGGFSVYINLLFFEWPPADGCRRLIDIG